MRCRLFCIFSLCFMVLLVVVLLIYYLSPSSCYEELCLRSLRSGAADEGLCSNAFTVMSTGQNQCLEKTGSLRLF